MPSRSSTGQCLSHLCKLPVAIAITGLLAHGCSIGRADDDRAAALARQIDSRLADGWEAAGVKPAPVVSDRVFIRRLSLDLLGRVPTVAETQTFLRDKRPDKRRQLARHLLASEDCVQHFADTFDTLLMGRGPERMYQERRRHQWRAHLERLFRDDRSWSDFVAETLLARPNSPDQDGSVWFLYERKDDHQKIAEAIAPAFFGIRIECAQCHDHPLAYEIEQRHYWGLVAFFNRGKNVTTKHGPRVSESAVGGYSEFADLAGDSQPNLLTFFEAPTIDEPRPAQKQEDDDSLYTPAAVEGDPRVPKFSRREKFVHEVVAGHPLVARAAVNRLWAMLMGRGIVHPHDEMDSEHPPSHPELLSELAEAFAKNGHRFRWIAEAIVSSRAYQLSSTQPANAQDPATFAWCLERPLTAEQWARSAQLALTGRFRNDAAVVTAFRQQFPDVLPQASVSSVKEAMFLSNNSSVQNFLAASMDSEGSLLSRLMDSGQPPAKPLFEAFFSRAPTDDERERIEAYLNDRQDRPAAALQQVAWALLTSAEFRFNH